MLHRTEQTGTSIGVGITIKSNFHLFSGAMTLSITNPIWVTKTRLVLQYNAGVDPSKRQYRGMFDALIKIYKTEGIRGLYKVIKSKKNSRIGWHHSVAR